MAHKILLKIKNEIAKTVVGQENLIDSLLIGLITNGNILIEGVPGLAKTTTVNALSKALGLDFKRIQFTPDLLPSDVTGNEIYNQKTGDFDIKKGPAFTNILLADEINRAPAKVQSALLEVMQEKQITIGEYTYPLDEPFTVLATQNPIEQEGTYNLPEAQLDRFMMKVIVTYNTFEEEYKIMKSIANNEKKDLKQVAKVEDILKIRNLVTKVKIDKELEKYILKLVFATRVPEKFNLKELKDYIETGSSPRGSIELYKASQAYALLKGRNYVNPSDIMRIAPDILRHRITLNYKAKAAGFSTDKIIKKILKTIPIP